MSELKKSSFEEDLTALESLVTQLESGELSLDQALVAFETGVKLTRQCQEALSVAEQKVQMLITQNGTSVLQTMTERDSE